MLLSTYSQTLKWVRSKGFFGEPLGHVITLCGQILVSRTDDDPPLPGVLAVVCCCLVKFLDLLPGSDMVGIGRMIALS